MVYENTISKNGAVTVNIFDNEESYKKIKNNEKVTPISKKTSKDFIYDFLKNNEQELKNKMVKISYITDHGFINNDDVVATGEKNIFQDKELRARLMGDPMENKHLQSGEYSNSLKNKVIYGVNIFYFSPNTKKKKKKTNISKFQFHKVLD